MTFLLLERALSNIEIYSLFYKRRNTIYCRLCARYIYARVCMKRHLKYISISTVWSCHIARSASIFSLSLSPHLCLCSPTHSGIDFSLIPLCFSLNILSANASARSAALECSKGVARVVYKSGARIHTRMHSRECERELYTHKCGGVWADTFRDTHS